jgi:exosortase A
MATPRDEVAIPQGFWHIARRWKIRPLIALCVIATFALYWQTSAALSALWLDTDKTTFTHGFIVLALTFWLILRDERFERLTARSPNYLALIAYLLCSLGWLVAYRAGIETAQELAFPVLAWLAVYALFGTQAARLAAFPIGFLIFAIPIWDVLTPYLQTVSAAMVGHMLHLSGISAYVEGSFVHIGVGIFEIAGGCSGLHFVMVGLALGALYGELGRDSIRTRTLLVTLAFVVAVAANWVRVYVIVVAGYLTNMQHYLVRVEHYRFGWVVFAVMMACFFWIASRFPPSTASSQSEDEPHRATGPKWRRAYVALGLLVVPGWNALDPVHSAPMPTEAQMRPAHMRDWQGPRQPSGAGWTPVFAGADAESLTTYQESDGQPVTMYVAAYRVQRQDKELVGYNSHLISDSEAIVDSRAVSAGTHELVVQNGGNRDLVRFSYHIGDLQTGSGFVAQLSYGVKSLWSAPLSRIVALRTQCTSSCEAAHQRLDAFELALSTAQ